MDARLLITGSPRSGTRWIALALRSAGLRVGHERLLTGGMVSSLAAVDDFYYVNQLVPKTSTIRFEHEWCQLRDPRRVIPSIAKALRIDFWRWQQDHTGVPGDLEPRLIRAAMFWCSWIPKCLDRAPEWVYRLEHMEEVWPRMLERLGLPQRPMPQRDPGRFSSAAEPISWNDLRALDMKVADSVEKLAEELGYAD